MSQDYGSRENEFAAAVAAAAFAIYSVEEEEENYRRKLREDFENSKIKIKTQKEFKTASSSKETGRLSSKEMKDAGEILVEKPTEGIQRFQESGLPSRKPSRSSSMRPMNPADQRKRGTSKRTDVAAETRQDSWEKALLRKINKRYEKMKSNILVWEKAKKMQATLQMEKKKNELEMRLERNRQHYLNKIARIDLIAGGARGQLEEKRRNEESEVKDKAKYMRSKGKRPVSCFCC